MRRASPYGTMQQTGRRSTVIGLSEQELREGLAEELERAMKTEGERPTIHAIAHSFARIIELDHLRIQEQLEQAGVRFEL
jgi:hypothetical protein